MSKIAPCGFAICDCLCFDNFLTSSMLQWREKYYGSCGRRRWSFHVVRTIQQTWWFSDLLLLWSNSSQKSTTLWVQNIPRIASRRIGLVRRRSKKRSNPFALIKLDVDSLQVTQCNDFTLMFRFSLTWTGLNGFKSQFRRSALRNFAHSSTQLCLSKY